MLLRVFNGHNMKPKLLIRNNSTSHLIERVWQ